MSILLELVEQGEVEKYEKDLTERNKLTDRLSLISYSMSALQKGVNQ